MTKTDLIEKVAEETGMTKKDTSEVVNSIFDTITEFLAEEAKKDSDRQKVQVIGFGSFEVRDRDERKGRNPKTNEDIVIPARKVPAFKAGKTLKDKIAGLSD